MVGRNIRTAIVAAIALVLLSLGGTAAEAKSHLQRMFHSSATANPSAQPVAICTQKRRHCCLRH